MCKTSYYLETDNHSRYKIKFELDLANHAKKSEGKKATGVNTYDFTKNVNLVSLKIIRR